MRFLGEKWLLKWLNNKGFVLRFSWKDWVYEAEQSNVPWLNDPERLGVPIGITTIYQNIIIIIISNRP
jgi:hypothetical protein